jgi:hypothetical protein
MRAHIAATVALSISLAGAAPARAEAPLVIDAFNRYHTSISTYRTVKEGFPWGWIPNVSIWIKFAGVESDDVLQLQHMQGRRKWGKPQKCRMRNHYKKVGLAMFECRADEKMGLNKGGKFAIQVSYKQAAADKLHKKIETLSYKVIKYKCDNRHVKRRWKPSSCFVVDHDLRMGEAWIAEVPKEDSAPVYIRMRTWFKYEDKAPNRPKLRCYLGDKKVAEASVERKQDEITYRFYKKARGKGQRVTWAKWYWHFYKMGTREPLKKISTVSYPDMYYLQKHPGVYRCVATADGDKLATLHFKVGDDGKIVDLPCQSSGKEATVRTLPRTHLIKVDYGKGANIKYDAKAFKKGPMWGRKWARGCKL